MFEHLFKKAEQLEFKKGEIIFDPRDPYTYIYHLDSGFLKMYTLSKNGEQKIHFFLKAGEVFPAQTTANLKPMVKYYEAMTPIRVSRMRRDVLTKQVRHSAKALHDIVMYLVYMLDGYEKRIDTLEYTSTAGKVAARLCNLASFFGIKENDKILIEVPVTYEDLAFSTGLQLDAFKRCFLQFKKEGIVEYCKEKLIYINDLAKLEAYL